MSAMATPAVVDQKARSYSLSELLDLRDSLLIINCDINRIFHRSAIATILRIPQKAFANPKTFVCTTKELIEEQNKNNGEQLSIIRRNDLSTDKSSSADDQFEQVNSLYTHSTRGNQRAQWLYRHRDSSDRSTQPYSAPSGLAAQQSENFQRFYRAVVSPTHVRVTAGGRIVPNTRAPPAFEWNGERFVFESRHHFAATMSSTEQEQFPAGTTNTAPNSPEEGQNGHGTSPAVAAAEITPEPVKISHPSQFDHSKPFMYNGQLVYPVPPGFQPPAHAQPIPITLLGNPNLIHHGQSANHPLGHVPAGHHHLPMMFPGAGPHHLPMMLPNGAGAHPGLQLLPILMPNGAPANLPGFDNMHTTAPFAAPLLPISEYTKRQLENLRAHLDHTDEAVAREHLTRHISQLEAMLATQLHQEQQAQEQKKERAITERVRAADSSSTASPVSQSEPLRKTRLSAAAAMAPPFKPRAHAISTPLTQPITQSEFARSSTIEETQDEIEARLLSKATGDWTESKKYYATTLSAGPPSLPKAHSVHAPRVRNIAASHPATMKRHSTVHGQSKSLSSTIEPIISPQAVPYLVGALPQGMRVSDAQASDLTYPRPLTEDEVRARYLYWGHAPRSVQKGLPKFDGKDFYPPSPVKELAPMATNSPVKPITQPFPVLRTGKAASDFGSLFTETMQSGIKSPPTPAPETNFQGILPSPTRVFLDNGIVGYRSPSPRPSTYTYDAAARPVWSTPSLGGSGYKLAQPLASHDSEIKANGGGLVEAAVDAVKDSAEEDETRTLDSWGLPTQSSQWRNEAAKMDSQSNSSEVEVRLTPQTQGTSPKHVSTFAERIASVSNADQQTQFLQNMLRNTAQTAPVLSGTVSAMNAQGYLPQYRGSAAASLAPTATNVPAMDRGKTVKEGSNGVLPLKAANFAPENRPLNRDRPPRAIRPSPETMGAEGYMRYITAKAEEDKKNVEQGWNASTTGTGPIMGSDW